MDTNKPILHDVIVVRLNQNSEIRVARLEWPSSEGRPSRPMIDVRRFDKQDNGDFKAGKGLNVPLRFDVIDGIQTALAQMKLHVEEKWKPEDEVKTVPKTENPIANVSADQVYAAVMADCINVWAYARNNHQEYNDVCTAFRKIVADLVTLHGGTAWSMLNSPAFYHSREFPEREVAISAILETVTNRSPMAVTKLVEFVKNQYSEEIRQLTAKPVVAESFKQDRVEFVGMCRAITSLCDTVRTNFIVDGVAATAFKGKQKPLILATLASAKSIAENPLFAEVQSKWVDRRRYATLFTVVQSISDHLSGGGSPTLDQLKALISAVLECDRVVVHNTADGREVVGYTIAEVGKKMSRKVNFIAESPRELLEHFDKTRSFKGAAGDLPIAVDNQLSAENPDYQLVKLVRTEGGKVERIPYFNFDWEKRDFVHVPTEA